jgi:TusA-related sulfurtransferase
VRIIYIEILREIPLDKAPAYERTLQAADLRRPLPVIKARAELHDMATGEVLRLIAAADTISDIEELAGRGFCELLFVEQSESCFYIRKIS